MANRRVITKVMAVMLLILLIALQFVYHFNALLISFVLIGFILLGFIIRFEHRKLEGREIVLLAVLSAIAAVSRIPFASLPSIQPTTFVVIMSGLVFGAESGFVVGATAALVSNLFLGQGPWTPWQMLSWALIGLSAGFFRKTWWMTTLWGRCLFGCIAGFVFGWVMNLWALLGTSGGFNLKEALTFYGVSFYFDATHALANVFFIAIFSKGWIKILNRFKEKYGLLS